MDLIYSYQADDMLPNDKAKAKSICYRSARYIILHKTLNRRGHSLSLMQYVTPQQENYILR